MSLCIEQSSPVIYTKKKETIFFLVLFQRNTTIKRKIGLICTGELKSILKLESKE